MDYKDAVEKQIKKLEEIQDKKCVSPLEACEIAKTIEYLAKQLVKYNKLNM